MRRGFFRCCSKQSGGNSRARGRIEAYPRSHASRFAGCGRDRALASSQSVDIGALDLSLEGSLDRINLARCIAQLPAGFRTMFVLHDIQGYEHHEIANILGRSVGDSKSQLHKARKRLRELLHEIQRDRAREQRLAAAKMTSQSSKAVFVY